MSQLHQHREESQLWEAIAKGDEEAFRQIFEHYYAHLYRFGMRFAFDPALVKDAIQEVFFDLWKQRSQLSTVNNHQAYLLQMLKYKLSRANQKKRDTEARKIESTASSGPSYESLLIAQQESEEQQQKLERAFLQLSPRQREIIRLRFFEGLSYDEIAQRSDVRKRTIYNQIHEALKVLKESFLLPLLFFLH
ncbi:MAG: sigma-70 family RNA polymerase sigma factor [Bacteroidota bacterium]